MLKRAMLSAFAGAMLAVLPQAASAQSDPTGLGNLVQGLLGFGDSGPPPIEYRERPGLVVPPRTVLPPPVDRDTRRTATNWPNDPDEAARRAGGLGESAAWADRRRMNSNDTRLTNRELAAGRGGTQRGAGDLETRTDQINAIRTMRDADAIYFRRQAELDAAPVGPEPRRERLTDPPVGARTASQRVRPTQEFVPHRSDRDTGQRDFAQQR